MRIWSHDHLLFDAEFLDSEFGSNRYRVSAFERGTWPDVVASALMLQLVKRTMPFGIGTEALRERFSPSEADAFDRWPSREAF